MTEKHNSLLHAVDLLLQRGVQESGDLYYVAVVSFRAAKHGMPQRRYTGAGALLRTADGSKFSELDDAVRDHLQHEQRSGVPLEAMGRSIFHMHSSLFRTACREGLRACGFQAVDVDVQACYLSLRYHNTTPEIKDSCAVLRELVKDPNAFYTALADSMHFTRSKVKQDMLSASNGGAVTGDDSEYKKTLQSLKEENVRIMRHEAEVRTDIFAHYKNMPNGLAKFMSVIDAQREAAVIDQFDRDTNTSNEYDGVVFYVPLDFDVDNHVERINKLIQPLRVGVKKPAKVLEMAQQKYGHLDWEHINDMPFGEFMLAYRQCVKALQAGHVHARNIDSVFSDVVRGRQHWVVTQGANGFDIWDESKHFWIPDAGSKDLADKVRCELRLCFGKPVADIEGNMIWCSPPAPCESDTFCMKIAECLPRYLRKIDCLPLDHHSNVECKLLFADGKIFDFNAMQSRYAEPGDRLARHCAVPLPTWQPGAEVLADANELADAVLEFYLAEGKSLEYTRHEGTLAEAMDGQDGEELRALRDRIKSIAKKLVDSGKCPWLKGVYNAFEDYDDMVFVMRIHARVLSGLSGFAEAYALTGPPSSSKSWLTLPLLRFLGQGPAHLAQPLPSGYFTAPPRPDGDSSRPVTAQLAGCKLCIPKEVPVKPIVAEALKAILDPRDVAVCARHNNSGKKDASSFTVTWAIVLVSQGSISQGTDDMDCGVLDKIVEMRPPFEFSEAPDASNPRHRKADPVLADAADSGALGGEMFWWARRMFATITRDVCRGRHLTPAPPACAAIRAEKSGDHMVQRVKDWMVRRLEHCPDAAATPIPDLHEALKNDLLKVDASCRTSAGLGPRRHQYRGGPKACHFTFYKCVLVAGGPQLPVRLKSAAASSSA